MADEFEHLAAKVELSSEEAFALKADLRQRFSTAFAQGDEASMQTLDLHKRSQWWLVSMDRDRVTEFLNRYPQTYPPDAMVTNRQDGRVDVYWYGPPLK